MEPDGPLTMKELRRTNFGHGHYRYICVMQSQLLAVEVSSRNVGTLSFPFAVLSYLRTEAPPIWCKWPWNCCTEPFGQVPPEGKLHFLGIKFGSRKLLVCVVLFNTTFSFTDYEQVVIVHILVAYTTLTGDYFSLGIQTHARDTLVVGRWPNELLIRSRKIY